MIYVNGRKLAEPYLARERLDRDTYPLNRVTGGYFVLGDSRAQLLRLSRVGAGAAGEHRRQGGEDQPVTCSASANGCALFWIEHCASPVQVRLGLRGPTRQSSRSPELGRKLAREAKRPARAYPRLRGSIAMEANEDLR